MLYGTQSHLSALAPPVLLAKGCANVIHLDKFKSESGARWPRIREGVYAKLEGLLRGMLGPADFFARIDDTAYMVVMPTTESEDVNVTCMRVAYDLHVSFLGQCGVDHIEVAIARSNSEADGLVLERLPAERVVALAQRAGMIFSSPRDVSGSAAPGPMHGAAVPEESQQPNLLGQYLVEPESQPQTNGLDYNLVVPIQTRLMIEHHFVPIWSVQHNAVTTYICEAKGVFTPGRRESIPLSSLTPNERRDVEMFCFQAGVAALDSALAQGRPFLLAPIFSFDIIGSPTGRKTFMDICHTLSRELRQYMAFVVHEIPLGVGQTRLATSVSLLRPFGRSVWATVAPQCKNLSPYTGVGLHAIGYMQREFGRSGGAGQHEIESLALFARRSNLQTFLCGVQNVNTLKSAQDAGIQFLSGDAVVKASEKPNGIWRLTWDKLLSGPWVEIWS